MSTRCNIIIKDGAERIYLYHHHDGYPLGVGTELQDYPDRPNSAKHKAHNEARLQEIEALLQTLKTIE